MVHVDLLHTDRQTDMLQTNKQSRYRHTHEPVTDRQNVHATDGQTQPISTLPSRQVWRSINNQTGAPNGMDEKLA